MTGGKRHKRGTPQGGVISPLLANLYMNRMLKYWRSTDRSRRFRAEVVAYADDFVILSRGRAADALEWTRKVTAKLGLALNEEKTSLRNARAESFDFLGYTFGPHYFRKTGHWYLGARPSRRSVQRVKSKIGDLLDVRNKSPRHEVLKRLNQILAGWSGYFSYGTRLQAYRAVDNHVYDKMRHFLRKRHKVQSRATRVFSREIFSILATPTHQKGATDIMTTGRLGDATATAKALFNDAQLFLIRPTPTAPRIGDRKDLYFGSVSMVGHSARSTPRASNQKDGSPRRLTLIPWNTHDDSKHPA
jgi:hypothetical protein